MALGCMCVSQAASLQGLLMSTTACVGGCEPCTLFCLVLYKDGQKNQRKEGKDGRRD